MNRRVSASLKSKALLLGILPAIVMSLLIGGYLIKARLNDLELALHSRGQALANELAAISVYGLFSGDTSSLEASAREFLSRPDVVSISVLSTSGEHIVHLDNPIFRQNRGDPSKDHLHEFESPARVMLTSDPLMTEGPQAASGADLPTPLGRVRVVLADRSLINLRSEVLITALLLIIGGIAVTSLLALAITHKVIEPIVALSTAVDRVRQGDLNVRVERHSRDEIGILEEGFNTMAARIALNQDELMAEVGQATEDLQTTMDALEVRNIQLDIARKKALKASQAKSDFLALISHEIRTPMNGIIGFARLLQQSCVEPEQQEQIRAIQDSADNLLSIINDVLDFAKLESGQVTFHTEPLRLRQLTSSIVRLFSGQARDKGLVLARQIDEDVPDHIMGDSLRIRQVLTNLLGNALKFTRRGQVTLRVARDRDSKGDWLEFSVRDTGIGISTESIGKLFQPFTQANDSTEREYGGTGLGLSISKKLVEGMHGSIDVESRPGMGSTFRFRLPLLVADEIASSTLPAERDGSERNRSVTDLSGLRLLVADDNRINLKLAQALLSMHGASVTLAADGEEAIALATQHAFDLILMDIHMPGVSGHQAARRIRSGNGPNAATPIIAVTADIMAENQQQLQDAGMNKILLKPFDQEKLLQLIHEFSLTPAPAAMDSTEGGSRILPAQEDEDGLPTRDPEAALRTAAGSPEVADELFGMLLSELDPGLADIIELSQRGDWTLLRDQVHKLIGACAACGVPALHAALQRLEQAAARQDASDTHHLIGLVATRIRQVKQLAGQDA